MIKKLFSSQLRINMASRVLVTVINAVGMMVAFPIYAKNLFPSAWSSSAIGIVYGAGQSEWPFAMSDLRGYDRVITDAEIVAMSE